MIELDKGYFTVETSEVERNKGVKVRGVVDKQHVLVMAESSSIESPTTGQKDKHVRYFKAKVRGYPQEK